MTKIGDILMSTVVEVLKPEVEAKAEEEMAKYYTPEFKTLVKQEMVEEYEEILALLVRAAEKINDLLD